ncbi:g11905 [Coccomyxa elongata]
MVMSKKRSREDAGLSAEAEAQLPFAGPYTEGGLLQLQATELIAARSVDYARDDALDSVLEKLQKDLAKLTQRVIAKPSKEVKQYLEVHGMPQRPLRFHPPASVRLIGSWAAHTAAQPSVGVDVAVEMPRACFDEKDHLNHRYFARRAQYLGELAAALRKTPSFRQVSWEFLGHDARKPVLIIRPQPRGQDRPLAFTLRLVPIIAPGTIPLQKLAPDRNCIRPAAAEAAAPDEQPRQELPPTPLYNSALLQDMLVDVQQAALQEAVAALPQLPDAIILLKVWARAQGLEQEPDSFNGFLLSMLAAHLATTGTLTPAMSPLQMARAVMQTLSKEGLFSRGVAMQRRDPGAPGQRPAANVFRERHTALFIDPSGFLNLAVHLSQSGLAQAQQAARRAVMLLDRPTDAVEVFEAVFLNPLPRGAPFDAFWRVSVPLPQQAASLSEDVPRWRALEARVEALVTQALGTRAKAVRGFQQQLDGGPDLARAGSPAGDTLEVFVAAQMDPATAQRAQDVGPPLDSPKASAFLDFWGNEIAEKTRFQDGHLAYAVTWEQPGSASATRHAIADRAVAHALKRHLAEGTHVTGHAALLDDALAQKGTPPDAFAGAHRALTAAVRNLTMKLRATSALPLRIVAVQPLSAALRDTTAFPPLPHPLATANLGAAARGDLGRVPRCLERLELLVQLEGSGRWPDHPEAFLKAKAAMGCQLADELATGFGLRTSASQSCVDVFAEGYAFRLFLSSDRDQAMAAKMSSPDEATLGSPGGQLAARATFGALQRQLAHHALMSTLAGTAPAFPPTARLAHRWLSSQMLSNQICQEAGELLVAAAFSLERGLPVPGE